MGKFVGFGDGVGRGDKKIGLFCLKKVTGGGGGLWYVV